VPLLVLAVSLALTLAGNLAVAIQQRISAIRLRDQQSVLAAQSQAAEDKLKALMMDLLDLAKKDDDARGLVKKYNIAFNAPPAPAAAARKNTDE
jgi:prophage DNA circulation protein